MTAVGKSESWLHASLLWPEASRWGAGCAGSGEGSGAGHGQPPARPLWELRCDLCLAALVGLEGAAEAVLQAEPWALCWTTAC